MSYIPYIHFACTSEDINNIAYSLMCQRSRDTILLPTFDTLIEILTDFAHRYADRAMMARTHGQGATPTTLGKEFANVVSRLSRERDKLRDLRFTAKMNGATGNYSAHTIAYPDVDWIQLTDAFIGRY
jgi:adenylosuccinate lyase